MKRNTGICFILAAYILVTACGGQSISGRIIGKDGNPEEGLRVALYDASAGEISSPVAESETDGEGVFRIRSDFPADCVLEIAGGSGAGRVHILCDTLTSRLELSYPVRETIVFLHDNDLHFDFNSLNAFQTVIDSIETEYRDVFLVNTGDVFVRHRSRWVVDGGPPQNEAWYAERAMFMIDTMNSLGYDLMTPGNHELVPIPPHTRTALDRARFPLIAANIEIRTEDIPPVEPYHILHTSTLRTIAVVGLTTTSLPGDSTGVYRSDPVETFQHCLHLADENDMLVAMTHIGYNNDVTLAERCPAIDLIIGGHSHTHLENAETVNTVLIAQTGGSEHVTARDHVKYLGEVKVILTNGEITAKLGHVTAMGIE